MTSIAAILADIEISRSKLVGAVSILSVRELTKIPIYEQWRVRDILAHIIGWDQRVLRNLSLLGADRVNEIISIDADKYNRQIVAEWRDRSLRELFEALGQTRRQVLDMISSLNHVEIDLRRKRKGRFITIRSYVIDMMCDHEYQHAVEINRWRRAREAAIDPLAIKAVLQVHRDDLLTALEGLQEPEWLEKNAVGKWSLKDLVGHVADWELRMLNAAYHIRDDSLPIVPPISEEDDEDEWNEMLKSLRVENSWQEELQFLHRTRAALKEFVAELTTEDWRLRGPYPWPDDQGTLAELLTHIAEHDATHLADIHQYRERIKG